MTLQEIAEQIRTLPVEERKQLVMVILDSLTEEQPAKSGSIMDFKGVGAHLRDDSVDINQYLNELRDEWDR